MYNFADDRSTIIESISANCERSFYRKYIKSCPFGLRTLIVGLGLISVILVTVGYQDDLALSTAEVNTNLQTYSETIGAGYGVGYKIEKLTQFYMSAVSICAIVSALHLMFLVCQRRISTTAVTFDQTLQLILATFLIAGSVCGKIGFENFRENCCRVVPFTRFKGIFYKYSNSSEFGYNMPCLCEMQTNRSVTFQAHEWKPFHSGDELRYANPHHHGSYSSSVMMALINCALYILAVFFP